MRNLKRAEPDIIHGLSCRCELCAPRFGAAERALVMLGAGMLTAVGMVAIEGRLGAALRALFGL